MRRPLAIRVSAPGSLRDVRGLRDHILPEQGWHTAAQRYAQEPDRYYASLHRIHTWFRDLWFGVGAEADEMRARALPRIAQDPSRVPDFIASGPDTPHDETARRRPFGGD